MKKILASIFMVTFLSGVFLMPVSSTLAQTAPTPTAKVVGHDDKGEPIYQGSVVGGAIAEGASCSVGNIIGEAIAGLVTKVVATVVDKAAEPKVPVERTGDPAREGVYLFGVQILPSWDAIAYCIGNALIQYVADATIQWINSGFNGNPAFIDNPEQYFQGISDNIATEVVGGILKGAGLCEPFRVPVALNTLSGYNSTYQSQSTCSLQTATNNVVGFLAGEAQYQTLSAIRSVTGVAANNYLGATGQANEYLAQQQAKAYALAHDKYLINGQYQDVVSCDKYINQPDPNNPNLSYVVPAPGAICKTTVTGQDIGVQGQNTRNMANLRLVAATKFDQVLTALVNQLIKVALNKLNEVTSEATSQQ